MNVRRTSVGRTANVLRSRAFDARATSRCAYTCAKAQRRPQRVSTGKVLLDIAMRLEHSDAFIQHVSGTQTRFKR
jgi:hypothetical protein